MACPNNKVEMDPERSLSPTVNSEIDLLMECSSPQLSEIQISTKAQAEDEYRRFMKKFNESLVKRNAEVVDKGSQITVYEMDCTPPFPVTTTLMQSDGPAPAATIKPTPTSALLSTSQANLITNNNVLLTNGSVTSSSVFSPTTYQLVVAPRMGLIVNSASPGTVNSIPTITNGNSASTTGSVTTSAPRVQVRPGLGTINPINNANAVQQPIKRFIAPGPGPAVTQKLSVTVPVTKSTPVTVGKTSPIVTSVSTMNTRNKTKQLANSTEVTPAKPTGKEVNAAVVDLTDDDGRPIPDSKEVALSRYPGKIYPSLVVVARPSLRIKEMTSSTITAERTQLDTKVKGILSNSATKFTEWLIQQGLVRSEQVCNNHPNGEIDPSFRKLKLGMYSDVSKFPYSGGYIWISDCCPQKFVSVFCNSIFEGAPHAPTILLKLMYHWACQTNVHNIISWVKVDNLYIKNFFTNLRAVCTAAVCEKFAKLGGPGKKIEVGVISLGTTSQNGNVRQVKVEVLGIMDPVTKYVRLRAVEPVPNAEKNHRQRFQRILEALDQWVHKGTTIITDYTVDRTALTELGFHSIIQSSLNVYSKDNNRCVMDYLKRVVPRMFQNTLSLLSKSIIQQFLDELVWRERWGAIPSRAFDNLITHLSEMTRLDSGDTLINRLKSITMNPFRDWSYKNWRSNCIVNSQQGKRTTQTADGTKLVIVKAKSNAVMQTNVKSGNKNGPTIPLNEIPNHALELPTIDNLPPSITEMSDDSLPGSSGSSARRSRTRNSTGVVNALSIGASVDDIKMKNYAVSNLPVTDSSTQSLMSLESYYYGTILPDSINPEKPQMKELNMKCFACGLTYNNNIEFMKHLAGHAQDEAAFTTDYRCKYCFKNFTTIFDLEDHEGRIHRPNKYVAMCYICLERFPKRGDLIRHMTCMHTELELPYQCSICKFRSSVHTAVVDHFYETHNGCEKVQCPFCLKIVSFESSSGAKILQNVNFFFNHLQRHQLKSVRRCTKCVLCFMNKNSVKEHLAKDHISYVNAPGVIRYSVTDLSSTLMPLPSTVVTTNRKGKLLPIPLPPYSMYQLSESLYYPEVPSSKCVECKVDAITPSQHFTIMYSCMNCRFSSCCRTMVTRHMRKIHDPKLKRKPSVHKSMPLPEPLYCVCGFSSSCGNAMASHLAACRRRVAYSSAERASQYSVQMQSATFPPLVNLDDTEQESSDPSERWIQAFVKNAASGDGKKPARSEPSPPRMLKELGLVRKGPEDDSGKSAELDNMSMSVSCTSEAEPSEKPECEEKSQDVEKKTGSEEEGNKITTDAVDATNSSETVEQVVNPENHETIDVNATKATENIITSESVKENTVDSEKIIKKGTTDTVNDVKTILRAESMTTETDEADPPTEKMDVDESTVVSTDSEKNGNETNQLVATDLENPEPMSID